MYMLITKENAHEEATLYIKYLEKLTHDHSRVYKAKLMVFTIKLYLNLNDDLDMTMRLLTMTLIKNHPMNFP